MAFSEAELEDIEKSLGDMCQQRTSRHRNRRLRISYTIKRHDVIVFQQVASWANPKQRLPVNVAKFTYIRTQEVWKLYWMQSDLKWHVYELLPTSHRIGRLVEEVSNDPYGAFFG